MTKEEAEKKIEELKPDWFCPVIRDMCRKDCIAYTKPHAYQQWTEAPSWNIAGNYCDFLNTFIAKLPT